jgi:hypothetical protein
MGGLSVPSTWDARVANLSYARPLASTLGDAGGHTTVGVARWRRDTVQQRTATTPSAVLAA